MRNAQLLRAAILARQGWSPRQIARYLRIDEPDALRLLERTNRWDDAVNPLVEVQVPHVLPVDPVVEVEEL